MELNVRISNSLSQNNFYADVAPEVDIGTSNPDTGFSLLSSVPPENLRHNTSYYATAASFPILCKKANEGHKTNQEQKI
jgi:hypothetical protein